MTRRSGPLIYCLMSFERLLSGPFFYWFNYEFSGIFWNWSFWDVAVVLFGIFRTLKHTWPSTCTQWHSQKGSKTCGFVLGTISTLGSDTQIVRNGSISPARFDLRLGRGLKPISGFGNSQNRRRTPTRSEIRWRHVADTGLVFVRVVTEFTTESGEMFEILLGDTAFYYRFKESGEMFEIMLEDTARPTSVFYHDHLEQ